MREGAPSGFGGNGDTANKTLNRTVSAQGTHSSGHTWHVTFTVTLSWIRSEGAAHATATMSDEPC